jgi:hypothetical protein
VQVLLARADLLATGLLGSTRILYIRAGAAAGRSAVLDANSHIFPAALAAESVAWSRTALLIALGLMILAATLSVVVVLSLARSRRRRAGVRTEVESGEDVLAILLERTRAAAAGEAAQTPPTARSLERLELCEIGWSPGLLRSHFSATTFASDGSARVVAVSPRLWFRREPPRARRRALKAYGMLVRQLGDAGWRVAGATELWFHWQPLGRRSRWYEERFRRSALGWTSLGRWGAGGVGLDGRIRGH